MASDPSRKTRYPWLFAIGTVLVIMGAIRLANDAPGTGGVFVIVGVVLIATRLIQQSLERSRRP